ncbi:somatostatin-1 [Epinephelus fuscoguttatus]|uniref:somatostatin-1 n=1 Tax=Epinephelus fuscoguttatus TaxID=293821 RepID=UPI0020D13881|nr:somatostatin-1 [Epinephelus fuscoguttatus]
MCLLPLTQSDGMKGGGEWVCSSLQHQGVSEFFCSPSEVEMLRSQVLLVALLSSVLLGQVSGAPRRDMLTLRADLSSDKDLANLLLLKFVSELVAARGDEMPPRLGEEEEEVGVREEVMRRHLPLSQRERKAGCRNFFWKTFTSC